MTSSVYQFCWEFATWCYLMEAEDAVLPSRMSLGNHCPSNFSLGSFLLVAQTHGQLLGLIIVQFSEKVPNQVKYASWLLVSQHILWPLGRHCDSYKSAVTALVKLIISVVTKKDRDSNITELSSMGKARGIIMSYGPVGQPLSWLV